MTEIIRILWDDVTEPATNQWASHIFSTPRTNISLKFSMEDFKIGLESVRGSRPFSQLDEYIYFLGEATILPKLDLILWTEKLNLRKMIARKPRSKDTMNFTSFSVSHTTSRVPQTPFRRQWIYSCQLCMEGWR